MSEENKIERQDRKGLLDFMLGKLSSRKLLVWGMATGLLLNAKLDSEHWVWLSLVYIGSQSAIDFIATLKAAGK